MRFNRSVSRKALLHGAGIAVGGSLVSALLGSRRPFGVMVESLPVEAASVAPMMPPQALAADVQGLYTVPPLPYDYSTLEPFIDTQTMQLHHDKHHQTYVTNLNAALQGYDQLAALSPDDLMRNLGNVPQDIATAVRNNGGGHANHSLFWTIMGPGAGGEPTGAFADAIGQTFGSFAAFKDQFTKVANAHFGSGWTWLTQSADGTLQIEESANQDTPLSVGRTPLLGLDVWEHGYYLKYKNVRADYTAAWWNVVNWDAVAQRYVAPS